MKLKDPKSQEEEEKDPANGAPVAGVVLSKNLGTQMTRTMKMVHLLQMAMLLLKRNSNMKM